MTASQPVKIVSDYNSKLFYAQLSLSLMHAHLITSSSMFNSRRTFEQELVEGESSE